MTAEYDFGRDPAEYGRAALEGATVVPLPGMDSPLRFDPTPFVWRDPSTIPRREFLYGFELRRKQLSAVVAPGAGGKTTLKVGRALCMVTGREDFGHRVWNGPHRVWLWNLEDEMEEVEKTVHAFCKHWNIDRADLVDRLFIDGVDSPDSPLLKLAVETQHGGYTIQAPVVEALVEALKRRKVDHLDVDPFVSSHSIGENDNGAVDAVSKQWVTVGRRANCAISLAHHIRKIDARDATAFDARGAVAMINAARSCLVLNRMSKEYAESIGISDLDRRRYFSVYDDKNNKAPPSSRSEWYRFVGVGLGNENVGSEGPEDDIGACERWTPPDAFGGITAVEALSVQRAVEKADQDIDGGRVRKDTQANRWVGRLVARALDLDLDVPAQKARVKTMVGTWLSTGVLKTQQGKDKKGMLRDFIVVGKWIDPNETR